MRQHPLGIYEKALPKDLSWPERLVLAKSCGFDFVEMSVDETDERLSRLDWSTTQRASLVEAMLETGVAIPSMCLSAHRRFPFGSRDETVRERAREIMSKAIRLARDLGIRTIQLAGRTRTLFGQQPDPEGYPALAAEPLAFDRQYYTDWLAALMHLIEGNADYEGGQTFDPEQNARLGRLINNLNPSVFTQDN